MKTIDSTFRNFDDAFRLYMAADTNADIYYHETLDEYRVSTLRNIADGEIIVTI